MLLPTVSQQVWKYSYQLIDVHVHELRIFKFKGQKSFCFSSRGCSLSPTWKRSLPDHISAQTTCCFLELFHNFPGNQADDLKHPADDQWPVYCLNLPVYLEPSLIWNLSYNMGTVRSRCLWPRFLWLYLFSIWLSWALSWVPTWWLLRRKFLSKNQRVFTCSLHNRLHPPWFLMKSGDPEPFLTYAAIGSACWETSHDAMSATSTMFM